MHLIMKYPKEAVFILSTLSTTPYFFVLRLDKAAEVPENGTLLLEHQFLNFNVIGLNGSALAHKSLKLLFFHIKC